MALSSRLLLFLSLVAITAVTGTSEIIVTKCYPPPTPTVNASTSTSAFRRDLLSLLDALPSAAARTGFASMRTGRSFARGLCFGDPAPDPCLRCLSDTARKIADLCDDANRRAGFMTDGCFLGYADTNASSAGVDDNDIVGVTFSGDAVPRIDNVDVQKLVAVARSLVPRSANGQVAAADATATASNGDKVRVLAQCATDRAPAECARCLRDSSLQMAKSWGLTLTASAVQTVLGPNCYLRFEISAPPLPAREKIRRIVKDHIVLTVLICLVVAVAVGALVAHACRMVRRKLGNAAAAPAAEGKSHDLTRISTRKEDQNKRHWLEHYQDKHWLNLYRYQEHYCYVDLFCIWMLGMRLFRLLK